jgi:RimJ/RimL family protein N-acetyltransferase
VEVRRVHAADWQKLREVRLRALADAPNAFASTLEREAAFADDVWRQRAKGGPASATFIARERGVGVGMAAVIAEPTPGRMRLVGMWVDPRHRRRGVAQALISQAVRWSRDHQIRELILWVAEDNTAARRLYARVDFRPVGARQPLPSNPAVDEVLLRLPLEVVDLAGVRAAEPDPHLLDGVVGLAERAEHPVGRRADRARPDPAAVFAAAVSVQGDGELCCAVVAMKSSRSAATAAAAAPQGSGQPSGGSPVVQTRQHRQGRETDERPSGHR